MNLFEKALKNVSNINACLYCSKAFTPDNRNVKRGWGLCCSKRCAVTYRNKFNAMDVSEKRNEQFKKLGL